MGGGSYGGRRWQLGRPARPWRKNNKKDWSVGPWTIQGTRGVGQGPGAEGCRPPFQKGRPQGAWPYRKVTRHRQGARGQGSGWGASWAPPSTAARMGCLGTRLPSLGGPKEVVRALVPGKPHPPTHHVEASGGFRSWLPLGIHSQKPGPPPSGGAEKLQATTVCYIRTGCCTGRGHLSLPLSTWALVNLRAWRMASGVSLQPTVILSSLSFKHTAHKPQGHSEGFERPPHPKENPGTAQYPSSRLGPGGASPI